MKVKTVRDLLLQLQTIDPETKLCTYTHDGMVNENVHCDIQYIASNKTGFTDGDNSYHDFEYESDNVYNTKVLVIG